MEPDPVGTGDAEPGMTAHPPINVADAAPDRVTLYRTLDALLDARRDRLLR